MGVLCGKANDVNINSELITEQVIFSNYSSSFDYYFSNFEDNYNLLRYTQLTEYSMMLTKFKFFNVEGVSTKQNLFKDGIDKPNMLMFIENKIMSNYFCYALKETNKPQLFKDFMNYLYESMFKGYMSYLKSRGEKALKNTKLKKVVLLCVGFLYCSSDNMTKLEILFNLFSNEEGYFEYSDNLDLFVYFLFLIASYASLKSLVELSSLYDDMKKLGDVEYLKMMEHFEVTDIIKIKEKLFQQFFGNAQALKFDSFKAKIIEEKYDWIFTPKGIRSYLEKLG